MIFFFQYRLCTISCKEGFLFPDGSKVDYMVCKDEEWIPTKIGAKEIGNCEPTCTPKCLNGGKCISLNVCQCDKDFRGPNCQYNTEACTPKKINFNGGYSCHGDDKSFSCSLYCPDGIEFEFEPAEEYRCDYATGIFMPLKVPQCLESKVFINLI